MVARKLVKSMPPAVIRRLLSDEGFSSFAKLSVVSYENIGSFKHGDVVCALERARDGNGKADLMTRDGRLFVLTRFPHGESVELAEDGEAGLRLSELRFLDPEQDVRLAALADAVGQCWPEVRSVGKWRAILVERPLSDIELTRLILDIRETPSQFLAVLERKWSTGANMGAADFFPTSLAYASALVGPPPDRSGVDEWIPSVLIPDLQRAIRRSLDDGLRRALALNVDSRLSPRRLVVDVPSVELLPALSGLVESGSPITLLGVVEIAVTRVEDDGGFAALASDALDRLFGVKSQQNGIATAWKLLPALVKAGLGRMSVGDELWSFPPFWRRLAAIAHANVLVELLQPDGTALDQFLDWLGDLVTDGEIAASLLDMTDEPLWSAWDLSSLQLRASLMGRLMIILPSIEGSGLGEIVKSAIRSFKAESGLLGANRPGPLLDSGTRMSDLGGVEGTDMEAASQFFSLSVMELDLDPTADAWKGLRTLCRLLPFDETLLVALTRVVERISMGEGDNGKSRFFEAVLSAAEVAATQSFEPLADSVGSALVREAKRFSGAVDAMTGYRILVLSSGAIRDRKWRTDWIGNRMSDYAFSLPRGEACRRLLIDLNSLETLQPIGERCFGRAKKFAAGGLE